MDRLKTIYFNNVENADGKEEMVFGLVDESDEVTSQMNIYFPVDSTRHYKTIDDETTASYWKIFRYKPLLFDIVRLIVSKKEKDLITSAKQVARTDLFDRSIEPITIKSGRYIIGVEQCIYNVFEVGQLIERSKKPIKPELFTTIAQKFFEHVFFAPEINKVANKNIFDKYSDLIFL